MAVVQVAFEDLDTWLQSQSDNTVDTPYELEITGINSIGDSSYEGTLGYILKNNSTKYVDLSNTVLPNTVTTMYRGFEDCTNLVKAPDIPESINETETSGIANYPLERTFFGCTSLKNPPVIKGVSADVKYMFYGCTSLVTAPTFREGTVRMNNTFEDCTALVNVPDFPITAKSFDSTFYNCSSLIETPVMEEVVTGAKLFRGCSSLTTVKIRKNLPNVISAQDYRILNMFYQCNSLSTFKTDIPYEFKNRLNIFAPSLTSLTFKPCSEVVEVPFSDLNNELSAWSDNTPQTPYKLNVTGLTANDIGDSSTTGTFGNIIRTNSTKYVDLSETILPSDVTDMKYCFRICQSLTTAPVIPSGVTDISYCFGVCQSLTTVLNIPNSVTDMNYCFTSCSSLEEITLFEADLESLANNNASKDCFKNCTSLTKIGVPPTQDKDPTESDWHAFRLKFDATTVQGKVYDQTGTAVTIPQTTVTKSTLKLPIKTDELWFPNGYNDAQIDEIIQKVIQYRYTYWNDNDVLDPAEKNFVLWADNPVNVKSNLKGMNPVDVIQSGNMNPVTSNAVANSNAMPVNSVTSGNMHSVTSNGVYWALQNMSIFWIRDTRDDNFSPSYYLTNYKNHITAEFKFQDVVDNPFSTHSGFCTLITIVPWGDLSGGFPTQIVIDTHYGYGIKRRMANANMEWGSWVSL